MNAYLQTLEFYKQEGYEIRTSLNPMHFSHRKDFINDLSLCLPFSYIYNPKDNISCLSTGGGINNNEIFLFQSIASLQLPIENIFIIGNAFGYSSIILCLLFPKARVVAIDAGIEGKDNMLGINLTNEIAKKHNLNLSVEYGFSPQDTKTIISKYFDKALDLVFIDGLHTNQQLWLDFEETKKYCANHTIYAMHDVINWQMQESFEKIKDSLSLTHKARILHRTQSGMSLCVPLDNIKAITLLESFSENEVIINDLCKIAKSYNHPLLRKARQIASKILPQNVKNFLKRMLKI